MGPCSDVRSLNSDGEIPRRTENEKKKKKNMRCITQEDVSVGVNWPLSQCDVYSAVVKTKRHHSGGVHARITSPVKRAVADDQIDNLASVLENHSLLCGKMVLPCSIANGDV